MSWYTYSSVAISIVAVTGNGVVAWLIITQSKLHNITNWFILSLAASDLLVGLSITPVQIACNKLDTCDFYLQGAFEELFIYESIFNLCAMTADRYISIVYPLKYANYVNTRCAVKTIALSWFIPLFNFCLHFSWLYSEPETRATWFRIFTIIETIFMVAIPCILLIVANVKIIRVAQLQSKRAIVQLHQINFNKMGTISRKSPRKAVFKNKTRKSRVCADSEVKYSSDHKSPSRLEIRSNEEFRRRFQRRTLVQRSSVKVIVAVIMIFLACWSLSLYASFCNYLDLCNLSSPMISATWLFMMFNPAINPIVFILFKSDLRAELTKKMASLKKEHRSL